MLEAIKDSWHNITGKISWFFGWLHKSFQYSKFLWNDYDFDFSSILRILQYKIGRVRRTIYENDLIENADFYTRQMIIAETMLEELINDDFADELHEAHNKKWGKLHFGDNPDPNGSAMWRENVKTKEDERQESAEAVAIFNEEERRRTKAYEDTFAYISKYIRYWWD